MAKKSTQLSRVRGRHKTSAGRWAQDQTRIGLVVDSVDAVTTDVDISEYGHLVGDMMSHGDVWHNNEVV